MAKREAPDERYLLALRDETRENYLDQDEQIDRLREQRTLQAKVPVPPEIMLVPLEIRDPSIADEIQRVVATLINQPPHLTVTPGRDPHHQNWVNCIKSREKPICDVEIGARSVTVCHLANLAYWNGRKLKWDPQKWEFPGDAEANGWRNRERRKPYELPEA